MKKLLFSLIGIFSLLSLQAQYTQTVRGQILDKDTKNPIAFVNVFVIDSTNKITAVTDDKGQYRLLNVPIGRQKIGTSYLGYEQSFSQVIVKTGNTVYLEIQLKPKFTKLKEVAVKVNRFSKGEAMNLMATTGARVLSMDQARKYAGALGDPSRLVRSFSGVSTAGDNRNDIVVRGNSPYGVLWRIDGVEVTNPNHFGAKGATGGPVSILNNNLLSNSDFHLGGGPAEFGTSFSGAFDLVMKKGNNQNFEGAFQLAFNGLEVNLQGPIQKGKSSFLFAYRYSFLEVLAATKLLNVNGVPKYQDLTLKTDFSTKRLGDFSFLVLGGLSGIDITRSEESTSTTALANTWNINSGNNKIITMLNHKIKLSRTASLKSFITYSADITKNRLDSNLLPSGSGNKFLYINQDNLDKMFSFGSSFRTRIAHNAFFQLGFRLYSHGLEYRDSVNVSRSITAPQTFRKLIDENRNGISQSQAYAQLKYNFTDNFFATAGVSHNIMTFNTTQSLDPRIGFSYKYRGHKFGASYNKVSKQLPFIVYFLRDNNTGMKTNENLEFMKSHQFTISDNWRLNEFFRIKAEIYYQELYDIPVEKTPTSYSLINFGASYNNQSPANLQSTGKGINYGIDLTLEKFLSNNWYFLATTSLFKPRYLASDKLWRNSLFDNKYVINFLGGYEYNISDTKSMNFNGTWAFAGGRPLTEYNRDGTINDAINHSNRGGNYFRFDIKISATFNYKGYAMDFGIEVQNVTNNKNEFLRYYNVRKGASEITYQQGILPVPFFRLSF